MKLIQYQLRNEIDKKLRDVWDQVNTPLYTQLRILLQIQIAHPLRLQLRNLKNY